MLSVNYNTFHSNSISGFHKLIYTFVKVDFKNNNNMYLFRVPFNILPCLHFGIYDCSQDAVSSMLLF